MPLYDLVTGKVKDDSGRLTDLDDYLPAIEAALERYGKHRPKVVVVDLAGDGSHDLALPAGWLEGFSGIRRVEYPIGEIPETLIGPDDWYIYQSPAGLKLRLVEETPAVGESVRLTYTAARLEADVVAGDLDAVASLAASICLRTLAAMFGHTSDPTIQADSVNRGSKTDEFRRLADAFEARYNAHLGIDPKGGTAAASAVAGAPRSGRTRLTH